MSTALSFPPNEPTAYISGGALHISDFSETDPTVVRVIGEADDPVAAVHKLLVFGAQGTLVANATADTTVLSDTVGRLTETIEDTVDTAVEGITAAAKALLDGESGELPKAFGQFKEQFESMLDQNLNPDSKKSVIAKFEDVLKLAIQEQIARMNRMLDPHTPDSPIGRWRDDLAKTVKEESAAVAKQVQDLSEKIAADAAAKAAAKAMFNKTTAKGFKFEDVVDELIATTAAQHQDLAVRVSRETGVLGTQQGDEVVALNPEDTRGANACIVWEFKDKKLSLKKILDELDQAMANREASVGIAVFGTQSYAPISVPFMQYGNKAVLAIDKDDPDAGAVRLAYMWSRWVARRELADRGEEIDVARIEALIDEAQRAIGRVSQIKKCHTSARKGVEDAATQVESLVREIEAVLENLRKEIENG